LKVNLLLSRFLVLLVLALAPLTSFAQVTKGSISGSVVDASGAVIADAPLKATNIATGTVFQAVSDKSGGFHFNLLPPGTYRVQISKDGFGPRTIDNVVVSTSEEAGLGTVSLGVAGGESTVEVLSSAESLIETTQVQVTNTFSTQSIAQFAGVNENQGLDYLALLVPGVTLAMATQTAPPLLQTAAAVAITTSKSTAKTITTTR